MYKSIQACRGAAAVLVLLFHLGRALALDKYFGAKSFDRPFSFGHSGVDFFFVLSGFIITLAHRHDAGKPKALGRYLWKRFVRIYPAYWIVFIAACLLALTSPELRRSLPDSFIVILKSLMLLPQDKLVVGGSGAPVVIVAWSLQYEILFYAFVASIIVSRTFGVLLALAFAANYVSCMGASCAFPRSLIASDLILLFGMGAGTAFLCKASLKLNWPISTATLGAASFLIVGLVEILAPDSTASRYNSLAYGLASCILIFGLVRAEDRGTAMGVHPWLQLLGNASYVLYLIHFLLISILCKALIAIGLKGTFGAAVSFVPIIVACLATAAVFHLWIEKPILNVLSIRKRPHVAMASDEPAAPAIPHSHKSGL